MTFGILRKAALEHWKRLADPCNHGSFIELPDSGVEAPFIWQSFSFPISCQWQMRAGTVGFGHISIFCSIWEWASNLTDTLLDHRFDDYPMGDIELDADEQLDDMIAMFIEQAPAILSRHYFRTLTLAAEILEDLTILQATMSATKPDKKDARRELSQAPLSVDALIGYANRICKHKEAFHRCNHHIPKRFLDADPDFDTGHYTDWNYMNHDFIEIPRYSDIMETLVGAFKKADELLRESDNLARVGYAFGKTANMPDE